MNTKNTQPVAPIRKELEPPRLVTGQISPLDLVAACHANSGESRLRKVVLSFQPIQGIAKICATIFASVDRDDSLQCEAARDAWLLKSALTLTALPFDDLQLGVKPLLDKLQKAVVGIPNIHNAVHDLTLAVQHLSSGTENPKRVALLSLLHEPVCGDVPSGILANICGSQTPGWPVSIAPRADFELEAVELIRRRRQTKNSLFSRIIIPGNPWFAPRGILSDLLYGGSSPEIVLISYQSEHAAIPLAKDLPTDRFFLPASRNNNQSHQSLEIIEAIAPDDDWAHEAFWRSIHSQLDGFATTPGTADAVAAKFVLFADGSGTFLPSEGSVVEVSDFFELGAEFIKEGNKLPRTQVRDLDEGDLVMLRLSGSGDYLGAVADSLMLQAGETNLRSKALQWKEHLEQAIKRHGEGVVAVRLRNLGVRLKSPQYIWEWAGETVMAPQDLQTFRYLIATTWELEGPKSDIPPSTYADERWEEMERLKAFHQKAGASIRSELIACVRKIISERREIETIESIELPGADSGQMALLRVAAVDIKSRSVSPSALFNLTKVKAASWHE